MDSLLDMYMSAAGISEIPEQYHRWCCLSAIAACVRDNVWLERYRGERLLPNLYTWLVGPSAISKGLALSFMCRMLQDAAEGANLYRGKLTSAYLTALLGATPTRQCPYPSKRFLVMDELSHCIGDKLQADGLVKALTDLYTGGDRKLEKGTLVGGSITVSKPCLNWAAGTTPDWVGDSLSKTAISGGFFTRIACITAEYNLAKRIFEPSYPPDCGDIEANIQARFAALAAVKGLFRRTERAYTLEKQWYMTREPQGPAEDSMIPWWMRQPALVSKLSMLCSLAESHSLVIDVHHITRAIGLSQEVASSSPDVMKQAGAGEDARMLHVVEDIIRRYTSKKGSIPHSRLLQVMYKHGVTAVKVKVMLDTLLESQKVRMTSTKTQGKVYVHAGADQLEQSGEG